MAAPNAVSTFPVGCAERGHPGRLECSQSIAFRQDTTPLARRLRAQPFIGVWLLDIDEGPQSDRRAKIVSYGIVGQLAVTV